MQTTFTLDEILAATEGQLRLEAGSWKLECPDGSIVMSSADEPLYGFLKDVIYCALRQFAQRPTQKAVS